MRGRTHHLPTGVNHVLCSTWFLCSPSRMKNPHLRAKLAEVLEAVMPHMEPAASGTTQPIMFQRERVFCSYRHAANLAEALISVFVVIEFTGEAGELCVCVCVCVCVCM